MAHDPVVFISSTSDDLKEHREQAAKAALASGFSPRMMEYFPARGDTPSLEACREMVEQAEVVVVLVAHRYGWVPDHPTNPDARSITWLECDHARKAGKEVLPFLVDPDYPWKAELKEDYRLIAGKDMPDPEFDRLRKEVRSHEKKLADFKKELSGSFRGTFTDAASVRPLVSEALANWRLRHQPTTRTVIQRDPDAYLKALEDSTRQIRVKGLTTKRAEPYFFGIDEIYIPLTTDAASDPKRRTGPGEEQARGPAGRPTPLEQALSRRKVVIVGDPGSGKSTFLRRVAFELCRNLRGTRPEGTAPFLPPEDKRFPILVRVADLAELLGKDHTPKPPDAPGWLSYFLGKQGGEYQWGADEEFFQAKLAAGGCLVMVDGLDEAPERRMRERIARLFENATGAFPRCDFLVSTRPQTNEGDSVLEGFHQVRIGELEPAAVATFLDHFARALALNDAESKKFKEELRSAMATRLEIREMAANPVMLTALAVLQHNDQRLPEYRVELYGSILGWLAAAREHKEGRPPKEECLKSLRKLALHMQDAPDGKRLVQVNKRSAAEFFTREFGGSVEANERLLELETLDSGIISSAGTDLRFWHLSFQEYLAALEIGGLSEKEQIAKVVESGRLYLPEWRETMRLLGGVLLQQGEPKVEGLFRAILGKLGRNAGLAEQVLCVALLSGMMRDLSRIKYQPKTPDYERTVKAVMGIFEAGEAEKIPIAERIAAADLLGQVGDPRLEDDNWVVIPPSVFHMGAQKTEKDGRNYDPEAFDHESPVHEVRLKGFRIRRFPVTVQEFGEFMKDKSYSKLGFEAPGEWEGQKEHPNRPVVGVNWFEAAAYCAWAGGRLPTEGEWERAARGPYGSPYPWGDKPPLDPSRANYTERHPTSVGLYPKGNTGEGLCDMLGNVWEWCGDWFGAYGGTMVDNPVGPETGDSRVLRGGSWNNFPQTVRVSFRIGNEPTLRSDIFGFRCAGD